MTTAWYWRKGGRHHLHISGHAGYAAPGEDIVCAGISAIGYALMGYLRNCPEAEDLRCSEESGRLILSCGEHTKVDAAFDMAVIGLALIERQYPQHVHIYADTPQSGG